MKTTVLIVDPMALARKGLTELFDGSDSVEVIAAVSSPRTAERIVRERRPDAIVFDLPAPFDGAEKSFREFRERDGVPLVLFTSLGEEGTALAGLVGCSEIVRKPTTNLAESIRSLRDEIETALRRVTRFERIPARKQTLSADARPCSVLPSKPTAWVIAIGASTGGTEAIAEVLSKLPGDSPGVLMVQHMPAEYTRGFAERLNDLTELEVREAKDGDEVVPGLALLAPGGVQMSLLPAGDEFRVRVGGREKVNGHCPSVDVLMHSVARHAARRAIGVLLTGMGDDGADGLKSIRDAGGGTIAQDEATCVVYGMPREAVLRGAAERVAAIEDIARQIQILASRRK
jgi:two-component system chemotaxis response regulator CheB